MTAELADCVLALRKRIETLEAQMEGIKASPARAPESALVLPAPEVTDVRQAVRAAVIAVDDSWKEQYATRFADTLLAQLNRAGWRLVKKGEGDL